jgi:acetyl esterase/lipase
MEKFIEMLREMFAESEAKRIDNFAPFLKQRDDITRYDNLIYGADSKWNSLDIYRPKNRDGERLPVVINVHGGGWIYGTKEGYQYYCMTLAASGYAVINFNYRLAPKYHFPAPMEDLNTLIHWLFSNDEKYQLDMEHLYAVGDSAGAHILGAYATICTNELYAANFLFGLKVPAHNIFKAIALNCGVYYANAEKSRTDFTRILVYQYLDIDNKAKQDIQSKEAQERDAKVIEQFEFVNYINDKYPDTFMMTAADDFVKNQSARLAAHLLEKSVNSMIRMYSSKERRLEHVFHCDLSLVEAERCNQDEIEFFQKHSLSDC